MILPFDQQSSLPSSSIVISSQKESEKPEKKTSTISETHKIGSMGLVHVYLLIYNKHPSFIEVNIQSSSLDPMCRMLFGHPNVMVP